MNKLIASVAVVVALVGLMVSAAPVDFQAENESKLPALPSDEEEISGLLVDLNFADFCLESRDLIMKELKSDENKSAAKVFFKLYDGVDMLKSSKLTDHLDQFKERLGLITGNNHVTKEACKTFKQLRMDIVESIVNQNLHIKDLNCVTSSRILHLDEVCAFM